MARAPLKLKVRKNQMHKDLGKPAGTKLSEKDITKEKARGGVFAKRARFAETARTWHHAK